MEQKRKPHPIPPIRRYRRAALCELALIVILSVLLAVIIVRMRTPPALEIREDRLMTQTSPVHVITMEPEPTPIVWVRYPVPLDDELQRYIYDLCADHHISPTIVFAIIAAETGGTWDAELRGDGGNSVGLMQIYAAYHQDRMERLGVTDLTDPEENIAVGVDVLAELMQYGESMEWVLMAYNGGPTYAYQMEELGAVSQYAEKVLTLAEVYDESAMVVTS